MTPTSRAWLQIHFCVLLWGFTAILGKLITLPAAQLVWTRMLIVSVALLCWPRVWRGVAALPRKLLAIYAANGTLIALHWLAFYAAIKLSNASVAATCIAMAPVFLAWAEPLVTKRVFSLREMLMGVAVIPGVALVVGGTSSAMQLGIVVGILSAALVAVFTALNKRFAGQTDSLTVSFVEIGAGTVFLTAVGPLFMGEQSMFGIPSASDSAWLAILALVCTLLPFALSLVALRHLTAFGAQLAVNLESVYAIVLAIPIFNEQRELDWQFYLGVTVIFAIVFSYPFLERRPPAPNS